MRLEVGQSTTVELGDKTFEIENEQYLVRIASEGRQWVDSVEGDVDVVTKYAFPELPYLFRFQEPLTSVSGSLLKLYVKLPLVQKLVIISKSGELTLHALMEDERKIWHGEIYSGVMCVHVEPEIFLKPKKGDFANLPVRFSNKKGSVLSIKKFLLEPKYMILYEGEKGFFINKVYVDIVGENEVQVNYGKATSEKAGKAKVLIGQVEKPPKNILAQFSPIVLSRHFGL